MSFLNPRVNIQRTPMNPLDRATIVSIFPKDIVLTPGLTVFPSPVKDGKALHGRYFTVKGAKPNDFELFLVGPASWFRELFDDSNTVSSYIEIPVPANEVARASIDDYCNGLFGCDMATKIPGIFWLPGEFTRETIVKNDLFKAKLEQAKTFQKNYFYELVRLADILFIRTSGMSSAIPDNCRWAAESLGILDKGWLSHSQMQELIRCINCGSLRNPQFPTCPTCHQIIDKELFKKLNG